MCKTVEREREGVMNDRNSLVNPAAKSAAAAVASVVTAARCGGGLYEWAEYDSHVLCHLSEEEECHAGFIRMQRIPSEFFLRISIPSDKKQGHAE